MKYSTCYIVHYLHY